jgi:hypothetical protein
MKWTLCKIADKSIDHFLSSPGPLSKPPGHYRNPVGIRNRIDGCGYRAAIIEEFVGANGQYLQSLRGYDLSACN